MRKLVLIGLIALLPLTVDAAQRAFVSAQHGVDSNPCSVTAPCRTFGAALAVADAGGEVLVLDSGGYGPFTITQRVAVIAPPGVYAGVATTTNVQGIVVNAPSAIVTIRGLTLNGLGTGSFGIEALSCAVLRVEDVHVSHFQVVGIGCFSSGACVVERSSSNDNGNGFNAGTTDPFNPTRVVIHDSTFDSNASDGVSASGYSQVVAERVISTNNSTGFSAGNTAGISILGVQGCTAAFNTLGLSAENGGSGQIDVAGSIISGNSSLGVRELGGSVAFSAGDNVMQSNGSDGTFSGTFTKH